MGGIKTPIEIESNLSWNRLVRETFQAIPVPESWNAQWKFQIPPVSYPANGFVYLVGVGSDSAPPTWRLGCSVRLASNAVPDSTGEFASAGGLPLRIDDRRPCTLGNYTLLTWPDMNLTDPHLIVEFPHWLQDATIEIFWYDGETTGDFFTKLRESLVEIFGDTPFMESYLGPYISSRVDAAITGHQSNENAHTQYLKKYDASQEYLRINDLDVAIADSDALRIALNNYILKSEAAAFVPVETFNQERTFVDASIEEAKAIAAADLAAHLAADNPHGITQGVSEEAIQQQINEKLTNYLATTDPLPQYLTQERGDVSYAPRQATEQAIASHLAATNPHGITPNAIGAATPQSITDAIASHLAATNPHGITPIMINAASVNHTHQALTGINSLSATNQSSQIGVLGVCNFLFLNFIANQGAWVSIHQPFSVSRAKVLLAGCVINNWEGAGGIMHGWKETDLIGSNTGTIVYQSVNLLLRVNNHQLQVSASSPLIAGMIQFQGIVLCYGY